MQPAEQPRFARYQTELAAHLRNPGSSPPAGAPERPLGIYRELLFNNLKGFVSAAFPISRAILGEPAWDELLRDFFIQHRCHSPLFRDIAGEFLTWFAPLAPERFPHWPFLWSFMHYEWLELAVSISAQRVDAELIDPWGDLLLQEPVLEPNAQLACYAWPVHQIGPGQLPEGTGPGEHHYLLYRDGQHQVRFSLLNPLSARLIERIEQKPQPGQLHLRELAAELGLVDDLNFLNAGAELLRQLRAQGALIGTWRTP